MKISSKLIMIIGSLLLIGVYFFPIWSISLDAPQYPEGIGLKIHVNTIVGNEENDLNNINNLNHYIGMKRIEPESIKELQYMPYIIGFMALSGVIIGIVASRKLVLSWAILFIIIGAIGLTDFYMWEYDYGHNLDPHAAIKIDGMSYQPPLIGTKQLLNFTAHSFPDIGGYLVGISILLALCAWFISKSKPTLMPMMIVTLLSTTALSSCSLQPDTIDYGKEECANCKMTIADNRFAAQYKTTKGKYFKFDAIECMAGYYIENNIKKEDIAGHWVNIYNKPGEFFPADKSIFLQSDKIPSPMGMYLSAYSTKSDADDFLEKSGGKIFYWEGVKLLIAKEWN